MACLPPFLLLAAFLLAPAEAAPAPSAAPSAAPEASPRERLAQAEALLADGRKDAALAHLLWCFDRGAVVDPVFYGQRMGRVLDALVELAASHPAAREALVQRRNAAEKKLLSAGGDWSDATDLAALSERLGDVDRALDLLATLSRRGPSDASDVLYQLLLDDLIERRRYAEAVAGAGDVVARVDQLLALTERTIQLLSAGGGGDLERIEAVVVKAVEDVARYYEALVGAGDLSRARQVADIVLDFDPSPEALQVLAAGARRAGRPEAAATLLQ